MTGASVPDLSKFLPMGCENSGEQSLEEGEMANSPTAGTSSDGMAMSFTDLLKVHTDDTVLLEEMSRPLAEIVSPIRTPNNVSSDDNPPSHVPSLHLERQVFDSEAKVLRKVWRFATLSQRIQ